MDNFQDRVAVVTGAASGIGLAVAEELARAGAKVVLADVEKPPLEAAVRKLEQQGLSECLGVACDVSQRDSVKQLAQQTHERFGVRVHVLCNNAGVGVAGALKDATHAEWQWVMGVNMWGVVHGLEMFLDDMLAHGEEAHIVNTASMAGHISWAGLGVYNASKYAVVAISETLAQELKDTTVGVSVLCPLGVRTGIFTSARNKPTDVAASTQEIDISDVNEEWLESEDVARHVMEGIRAKRRYIFTHKISRRVLTHRFQKLLDDCQH